jgi:hypothetical protein
MNEMNNIKLRFCFVDFFSTAQQPLVDGGVLNIDASR